MNINYSRQFLDQEDIKSVVNCLKGEYLTQGPYKKFEKNCKICKC